MLLKLGKVFVVFSLVATLIAHWALLQTVAWTAMLARNLESWSFQDAVTRTFDGEHPCPFCKAIAADKNSEQKNSLTCQNQKLEFLPSHDGLILVAPSDVEILCQDTFAESMPQKPPTPPPRPLFT